MQVRKFLLSLSVILATFWSISGQSWARSATMIVAREKVAVTDEMAKIYAWPEGTLTLVNLPQRTVGWHHTVMHPGDLKTNFAFSARDAADVQDIIDALAAIKSKSLTILLDPGNASSLNAPLKMGNNIAAVFAVGSQKIVDEWYLKLPVDPAGKRKFGQHLYEKPPTAVPPLLTLYVGHTACDLNLLNLPLQVNVESAVTYSYLRDHPFNRKAPQILKLIAEHKEQQTVANQNAQGGAIAK